MVYGIEELEEIIDKIVEKVTVANRLGELDVLLNNLGLSDVLPRQSFYDTYKEGKIVVIGASEVKEKILRGIASDFGIDKGRFEFCLEYDKTKYYDYRKLQYNPNYRVVLVGPIPHSSVGKGDSGSVISEMQTTEGYPRVIMLGNNDLKITKSSFRNSIQQLVDERYI